MKFLCAEGLDKYPIEMVCRVLGISRSVYYQRSKKPETPKDEADSRLKEKILSTKGSLDKLSISSFVVKSI